MKARPALFVWNPSCLLSLPRFPLLALVRVPGITITADHVYSAPECLRVFEHLADVSQRVDALVHAVARDEAAIDLRLPINDERVRPIAFLRTPIFERHRRGVGAWQPCFDPGRYEVPEGPPFLARH